MAPPEVGEVGFAVLHIEELVMEAFRRVQEAELRVRVSPPTEAWRCTCVCEASDRRDCRGERCSGDGNAARGLGDGDEAW